MLPLLAALLLAALPQRPWNEERQLLDRRLETLRRILPDAPSPVADAALVRELAEAARLQQVESLARPPLETGARGEVPVDLRATASFAQVERFFRQAGLSHRLLDVQSLELVAAPGDQVRLSAVFLLPYRPLRAPLPPPPDGTRARVQGVPKAQADAFIADQALALAKSEQVASLRRSRRNPRVFLAELGAIVRERPVVLTSAVLGEEFSVRGLTLGEGPVRALQSRFERGFFRVSHFLMSRQGACLRFEARGTTPVAGPEAELPLPTEDPFEEAGRACAIDRDAGRTPAIRNPLPPANSKAARAGGPLTLRLRDVDLTDVFQVLQRTTGQGFVVDGDVTGRASVELVRVSLEEALGFISKTAELRIGDPGPLRRVALARNWKPEPKPTPPPKKRGGSKPADPPPPEPDPLTEPPQTSTSASFELKRVGVRELLAVMTDVDPGLASLGPSGFLGKLSVWAKDVRLDLLRNRVLQASGLVERFEEGRRLLERPDSGAETPTPVAGEVQNLRLVLRGQDLAALEFQPAGVASNGNGWTVFAYAPGGALFAYRSGDRLADAVLKAVESTDVVVETEDGDVRYGLAPLP